MGSELRTDGGWQHTFRQSFLGSFAMCPEKARHDYYGLSEHRHNDATALGTAFHAAAEYACYELRDTPTAPTTDLMVEVAHQELATIGDWDTVRLTRTQMDDALPIMCDGWIAEIMPAVEPLDMEYTFHVPLYEDDERVIALSGTMDCVAADGIVWDWKTSSSLRGYTSDAWEKRRWAVQPTVYLYAHSVEGGPGAELDQLTFRYAAIDYTGKTATLDIVRHDGHVRWLTDQTLRIARLIESDVPTWPLNDAGWHCSPKWCDLWADCKGAHIEAW